jgi:hypothetical protein
MKPTVMIALAALSALAVNAWAGTADDVEQGMRDVRNSNVAQLGDAAARADAVAVVAAKAEDRGPAYNLGIRLGAVLLELDSNVASRPGDRPAVEREVREVVAAQQKMGLSDRAVCLLSGREDPSSFEALMRLAAPGFTCGHHHGRSTP